MNSRLKSSLLAVALLCGARLAAAADAALMVEDPWVREAPPTAAALGGFMVLHNHSDRERSIVGASSPAFGSVELHRTVPDNGVMRMVAQEKLSVPAHGQLKLEPGSYHLMLMQPRQPLRAGDKVEVTLRLDDGSTRTVVHEVRAMGMDHGGAMMHHHH